MITLFILLISVLFVSDAYAHPDELKAVIGSNQTYAVIDLTQQGKVSSSVVLPEPEFLSNNWFQKYVIEVLSVGILVFMSVYCVILYRDKIHVIN